MSNKQLGLILIIAGAVIFIAGTGISQPVAKVLLMIGGAAVFGLGIGKRRQG
jgi:hypothetical protein